MKQRTYGLLSMGVSAAAGALLAGVVAYAQSPSPDPRMTLEHYFIIQGEAPPGTWKQLSDDVRLLVFKSDRGDFRARLYVKLGEKWQPVAAEGLADLKGMFPAK